MLVLILPWRNELFKYDHGETSYLSMTMQDLIQEISLKTELIVIFRYIKTFFYIQHFCGTKQKGLTKSFLCYFPNVQLKRAARSVCQVARRLGCVGWAEYYKEEIKIT